MSVGCFYRAHVKKIENKKKSHCDLDMYLQLLFIVCFNYINYLFFILQV